MAKFNWRPDNGDSMTLDLVLGRGVTLILRGNPNKLGSYVKTLNLNPKP
jgi:hypothetical protein